MEPIAEATVTGKRLSLRKISAELAKLGHLNEQDRPYNPKSVLAMIDANHKQQKRP